MQLRNVNSSNRRFKSAFEFWLACEQAHVGVQKDALSFGMVKKQTLTAFFA